MSNFLENIGKPGNVEITLKNFPYMNYKTDSLNSAFLRFISIVLHQAKTWRLDYIADGAIKEVRYSEFAECLWSNMKPQILRSTLLGRNFKVFQLTCIYAEKISFLIGKMLRTYTNILTSPKENMYFVDIFQSDWEALVANKRGKKGGRQVNSTLKLQAATEGKDFSPKAGNKKTGSSGKGRCWKCGSFKHKKFNCPLHKKKKK